jgi:hypothetical protein
MGGSAALRFAEGSTGVLFLIVHSTFGEVTDFVYGDTGHTVSSYHRAFGAMWVPPALSEGEGGTEGLWPCVSVQLDCVYDVCCVPLFLALWFMGLFL